MYSCNEKLGKLVLRVFSRSHVVHLIDLFIHLILNSRIILERNCFVLISRILYGTCGLKDNSSKVTKVSVVIVCRQNQEVCLDDLHEKLDRFQCDQEEQDDRLMNQCTLGL